MKCLLQSPCPHQLAYCECGNLEECEYKGKCTDCEWFYMCNKEAAEETLNQ